MKCIAPEPITGALFFKYSPVLETQTSFQMPFAFDLAGNLQREMPAGTGRMVLVPAGPIFTPPAASHMIAASAGNKVWAAFSDLLEATSQWCSINPYAIQNKQTQQINPAGMKPVGWYWQPNTPVIVGEYCCPPTPTTGNGHTYRCIAAGTTAAAVGAGYFPTTEGATFNDGTTEWQESTMVMANRLDPPAAPGVGEIGGGTWGAGLDVYVVLTLENNQGETLPSPASFFSNTPAGAAIVVNIPTLASMPGWVQGLPTAYVPNGANVYVASVAHNSPAPALSAYQKSNVSPAPLGSNYTASGPGTGQQPPTTCTARVVPGQVPTPIVGPTIERDPGAGTFPAGRDVYVLQTYTNSAGETKAGPASSVINTVANDGILVTIAEPEDDNNEALYDINDVGIYEADVVTGLPAPPSTEFQLVGFYPVGAQPVITASATGINPPTSNSTGPGGAIAADTSDGGMNGGQGYRYAAALFMNTNETVSGFTQASVIRYIVDEDGWELAFFNIPIGPPNIVARLVAPTGADSSQDGPFNWLGLINLTVPTQNVVYPQTTLSGDIEETATAIFDNVTTTGTFNFDDTFLANGNNVDDRLDILPPFNPVRVDFLKTINTMAFSGVKGYMGGGLISIPGDYESVYADTGQIPFAADGETCYGFTDAYKSTVFALRSDGGFAIETNTGNPSTWQPIRRWSETGPCGFRAWAAIGKFICWANEDGFFRYDESDPDLLAKEVPRSWSRINWAYKHLVSMYIDEPTHTVRVQVPTGLSTVPNEEFCLSYLEGWQNPIHFSTFSGKEISMDAARRWSFNDIAAYLCVRMRRRLAVIPKFQDGPDWETQPSSSFGISQLLYCSSGYDGGIHARTPGVYSDNGQGIDWRYETMSSGMMQALCKPEGFNLNADGNGTIYAAFVPAREQVNGPGDGEDTVWVEEIAMVPGQKIGITRKCPSDANEFWRVHFDNNKQPGAWCSLKFMTTYMIPVTGGRDDTDQ